MNLPNKFAKKQLPYLVLQVKQSSHLEKSQHHLINKVYSSPSFQLAYFHLETVIFKRKKQVLLWDKILGTTKEILNF